MIALAHKTARLMTLADVAGLWTQMARFWSFEDPAVRTAVAGTLILGMTCGLLGSFLVLRRMSLLGDSLGHAVLPGVCAGFLLTLTKDVQWIFLGALFSALLAVAVISVIHSRTRLKPDVAMGLVLSGFYGLGVVMLTRLQSFPLGNQSGLDRFLFGQASAIADSELVLMAILSGIILVVVLVSFKELAATSFDKEFAAACGLPVRAIHYLLMLLVTVAIVISIHAVGIVLISAMLITPAATAHLLTDRLKVMVLLSVIFGAAAGVAGANISFLESNLPTGPFIVAVLTLFFVTAFLFSPTHGLLTKLYQRRGRAERTRADSVIRQLHAHATTAAGITETQLTQDLGLTQSNLQRLTKPLCREGLLERRGESLCLTQHGREYAESLDRNRRLWDLLFTEEPNLADDQFNPDIDDIETVLGAELVRQLETKLKT